MTGPALDLDAIEARSVTVSASPVPPGAPLRIWLNLCDEADCGEPFESHHGGEIGVTWTEGAPALLHAVEYARADLLLARELEVRRLRAALAAEPPAEAAP